MKKLAIATAVAAAAMIGSGAHAVTSVVSDAQLYISNFDIEVPCNGSATGPNMPYVTGLTLSGNIAMTGQICLDPGTGVFVALTFNLSGTPGATGTTFNVGNIDIDLDSTSGGAAYAAYTSVDASVTAIPCLVNLDGHLGVTGGVRGNTTFGLHKPPVGITSPLPGLWHPNDPTNPDDGINDAVCVTSLFGQSAGLYLEGTITN